MSHASAHVSWIEKIQSRAAYSSRSNNNSLIQLGISCMSFSTTMVSTLEIWRARQTSRPSAQRYQLSPAESTSNSRDHADHDQAQLQLIVDSIRMLSSQVQMLNDRLDEQYDKTLPHTFKVNEDRTKQQDLTSVPGQEIHSSPWITSSYVLAAMLWIVGATLFVCGLKRLSVNNASRLLTWGLGAGSLGLSLAMFWKNVENGWVYVAVGVTPAYVAMIATLSFLSEGEEGIKKG